MTEQVNGLETPQPTRAVRPSELLKRGWWDGRSSAFDKVCLVTAAELSDRAFYRKCDLALGGDGVNGTGNLIMRLVAWNDAPGRTQAEVVALAEAVEAEMEAEGLL